MENSKFKIINCQLSICNSREGFTLLEILVSIAILSIALVVILQLFSANLKGITASDGYVNAVIKAESIMRDLLDDDALEENSLMETTEDGYDIEVSITGTAEDRTENLPVKLLEIDLSIRWRDGIKERKFNLKTMKLAAK